MSEVRIPASGDPFTAAPQDRPHICNDGFVYIGHAVEAQDDLGEAGEEIVYDRVPCRRCAEESVRVD
jgi:hypothetical protein